MTLRQCIRKIGWQIECNVAGCRYMTVDINFLNEGEPDEVQFDIRAYNIDRLEALFEEFCNENGYKKNTVISVTIVSCT